jgi:hypothetical protein
VSGPSRIAVPLLKAEDVIPHLGKPSHWKQGRSAKALADSWFDADGIPKTIQVLLASAPELSKAELIDGWLERKTDLRDHCGAPSQTDLLALLDLGSELAVMAIEAKVDESFGPFVHDWIADGSLKKHKRLRALCGHLGVEPNDVMPLRYQLLHRTVAALIEAQRFHARKAVLAVQSFCPNATGHQDFAAFCEAIGFAKTTRGKLAGPNHFDSIDLWVGWMNPNVWDAFFDEPGDPDFPTLEEIRSDRFLKR